MKIELPITFEVYEHNFGNRQLPRTLVNVVTIKITLDDLKDFDSLIMELRQFVLRQNFGFDSHESDFEIRYFLGDSKNA